MNSIPFVVIYTERSIKTPPLNWLILLGLAFLHCEHGNISRVSFTLSSVVCGCLLMQKKKILGWVKSGEYVLKILSLIYLWTVSSVWKNCAWHHGMSFQHSLTTYHPSLALMTTHRYCWHYFHGHLFLITCEWSLLKCKRCISAFLFMNFLGVSRNKICICILAMTKSWSLFPLNTYIMYTVESFTTYWLSEEHVKSVT